jgi:competence protein ComEC
MAIIFVLVIAFILALVHSTFPGHNWEVVNCDVGQGDGLAINLGESSAIVIDTGPDPKLIDQCLNNLKIKRIPLLILTHFHQDHVGGLSGVMNGRNVGQVWMTSFSAPLMEHEAVLKELGNIPQIYPTIGYSTVFNSEKGLVKIKVLWPTANYSGSSGGNGTVINNSSIAALISINKLTIFATGDIEPESAASVFAEAQIRNIDILKVPHHGSAYQFPPLIQSAHPKVALISVGAGNRYGHPAPNTLSLLESTGAKVLRTDRDGAIAVDPSLSIRTKRRDWWDISWG